MHSDGSAPVGPGADRPPAVASASRGVEQKPAAGYVPPPLPAVKSNLVHIVVPSTAAWFLAFIVLLFFIGRLRDHDDMIYLWTCLAGWVLGLMGLSVYALQRRATLRGRRGAQTSALEES